MYYTTPAPTCMRTYVWIPSIPFTPPPPHCPPPHPTVPHPTPLSPTPPHCPPPHPTPHIPIASHRPSPSRQSYFLMIASSQFFRVLQLPSFSTFLPLSLLKLALLSRRYPGGKCAPFVIRAMGKARSTRTCFPPGWGKAGTPLLGDPLQSKPFSKRFAIS